MDKLNLYQKISKIMQEVTTVEKGARIQMGGGSYCAVSHDDVASLLHLPCANIGIVLASSVVESSLEILEKSKEYQGKVTVSKEYLAKVIVELTAINSDEPSERLTVRMPAIAFDPSDKCFGKAISMATKYCCLKLFMLESVDEEESRSDAHYSHQKPQSRPFNQPTQPKTPVKLQNPPTAQISVDSDGFPTIENFTASRDVMKYRVPCGSHQGKYLKDVPRDTLKSMVETIKPKMDTLGNDWKEYVSMAEEILK